MSDMYHEIYKSRKDFFPENSRHVTLKDILIYVQGLFYQKVEYK